MGNNGEKYRRWLPLAYKIANKMAAKWGKPVREMAELAESHLAEVVCCEW